MRPGPTIKIKAIQKTTFGRSFETDSLLAWEKLSASKIAAGDAALKIFYVAKQPVTICSSVPNAPEKIKIKMPYDSEFAYWLVSKSDRSYLSYYGKTKLVNPCAASEIADLEAPSLYWYVWNPDAFSVSSEKVNYDCRKLLSQKDLLEVDT
jgi:hypothetical protein